MAQDTAAPTREQVEAMEQTLGCIHANRGTRQEWCTTHNRTGSLWGCEVAVAAARHEAATVAEANAALDRVRALHTKTTPTPLCNECELPWPCETTRAIDGPDRPEDQP